MSTTKHYLQKGYVITKADGSVTDLFQLEKMVKNELENVNVTFLDPCCLGTTEADHGPYPLRYLDGNLQYLNGDVWTNFDTTPATITTNTINEQTTDNGVNVDGTLIKDGGITANSMVAGFYPTAAAEAKSGAGAINITSYLTKFTSTGAAQALTLASGSQIGQMKRVWHVVDGGSGVMTGVYVGGTTITFTTANEFADLIWDGASWGVLALGNFTAAGASPALA